MTSTFSAAIKNKWILFAVAIVLITVNLLNADFTVYEQLSLADFMPVIVIALISFLIKTGVLSGLIIGIRSCVNGEIVNKSPGIATAIPGSFRLVS